MVDGNGLLADTMVSSSRTNKFDGIAFDRLAVGFALECVYYGNIDRNHCVRVVGVFDSDMSGVFSVGMV